MKTEEPNQKSLQTVKWIMAQNDINDAIDILESYARQKAVEFAYWYNNIQPNDELPEDTFGGKKSLRENLKHWDEWKLNNKQPRKQN